MVYNIIKHIIPMLHILYYKFYETIYLRISLQLPKFPLNFLPTFDK